MNQCRSSTDAERLVSTLDKFIENGRPMQESRLQRMSELVIELYGKSRGYQNLSLNYITVMLNLKGIRSC